ncbi:MAG: hypothetical protein R3B96_23315, partial [Pirellulaceae bacterium]
PVDDATESLVPWTETDSSEGETEHRPAPHRRASRTTRSGWELEPRSEPAPRISRKQWKRSANNAPHRQRTTWMGGVSLSAAEMRAWADEVQERNWLEHVEREVVSADLPHAAPAGDTSNDHCADRDIGRDDDVDPASPSRAHRSARDQQASQDHRSERSGTRESAEHSSPATGRLTEVEVVDAAGVEAASRDTATWSGVQRRRRSSAGQRFLAARSLADSATPTDPVPSAPGPTASVPKASVPRASEASSEAPPRFRSYPLPFLAPIGDRRAFGLLPIEALRLDRATCEVLHQLGIQRVRQLAELPRDGLATRLGSHVLLRWDQVWGRAEESWRTFHATPDLSCELDLEVPSGDRAVIESWLEEVLRRVIDRLWERRRGALRLRVTLRGCAAVPNAAIPGSETRRSGIVGAWALDLFRPTIDQRHLMDLLRWQTERQPPRAAVAGIDIEVLLDGPLEAHQQELFEDGSFDRRAAAGLIETLSGRLGRDRVVEVVLRGDPQPEKAYTTRPVAGSGKSRLSRKRARYWQDSSGIAAEQASGGRKRSRQGHSERSLSRQRAGRLEAQPAALPEFDETEGEARSHEAWQWSHVQRRPPRCWGRPVALEVIALAANGPPATFRFAGQVWRVADYWGPERIETGWWRGSWVRRDYYRVETEAGYRFWIFRCLESREWFLHGAF